jgi:hypothetical protein
LAFFTSIGNSLHSGKTNERAFHIAIPLTVSMLGNVLCVTLTNTAGRYASMFLMTLGVYSAFNVTLSWVSSTIPRPKSKRAAALASKLFLVSNQLAMNTFIPEHQILTFTSGQFARKLHTSLYFLPLSK